MKNILILPLIVFLVTLNSCSQNTDKLTNLFDEINKFDKSVSYNSSLYRGVHPKKINFKTSEQYINEGKKYEDFKHKLDGIDNSILSKSEVISKAIMEVRLNDKISNAKFKRHLVPFNAEGGFFNRASFFLSKLPFKNYDDYQNYLNWLPSYSEYIKSHIDLLKEGIEENVIAPKVIVKNFIKLIQPWIPDALDENPFFKPFKSFPENISVDLQKELFIKGKETIDDYIRPAYEHVLVFMLEEYLPASPEEVGVITNQKGKEFYENRIKHFTTLEMSPNEVFETGQQEVKRIRSEMDKIILDLKFKGSFDDFLEFLRTDSQFYANTPQELLNKAAWLSKKAEGQLPKLFSHLYELPFTVEPVPDDIAPTYTGGRYVGGSRKENRPGTYWVNTYNLKSRTLYTLPSLSLHEAVPGHHLQNAIAAELKDIPDFRKSYYISAFGEGWGLYTEFLGEEMGMYETPYELFGRYTYEMWRACRLVVDVGLHYKGWTRKQAVEFLAKNTALSLHEVNTEIDRYIGWPGQAVSYKIGEITIRKLRTEAEETLGDKFDIQKFHQIILENGSVPLTILKKQVESYINQNKNLKE